MSKVNVAESFGIVGVYSIGALFGLILCVTNFAAIVLLYSWVFTKLWDWFIVEHFSMSPISIPIAIGVYLIVSLISNTPSSEVVKCDTIKQEFSIFRFLMNGYLRPLLALGIGWLVHTYFM